MPRSFTPKPCPGCGLMANLAPNTVCQACYNALRDHKRLVAAASLMQSGRLYSLTRGIAPRQTYSMAGKEAFEQAFADLLSELCPAVPEGSLGYVTPLDAGYEGWFCGSTLDKPREFLVAGKDVVSRIHRLFRTISDLIRQSEAAGVIKGQDLLGQLGSGALSTLDINRMTLDAEKVIRGGR